MTYGNKTAVAAYFCAATAVLLVFVYFVRGGVVA